MRRIGFTAIALSAVAVLLCPVLFHESRQSLRVSPETSHESAESFQATPPDDGPHFGYTPAPRDTERFLRSLDRPTFARAAQHLQNRAADDTPVLLYRALYEAHQAQFGRPWIVGRQGIGDCVSWGWGHAADVHLAVLWKLGEVNEWQPAATEAIYGGSRVEASGKSFAGWGDGSYGGAAARWVSQWGLLYRRPYDHVDLTEYSADRAKQWGAYGCGGRDDDGKLDTIAKQHPVRHVALVRTFEEAAAAIANGYPVPVCSGQGFRSTRDSQGFAAASGAWSHCMVFIGVRFDRRGLLCLNSWGPKWITGPKWPDDQPDGSFWVEARVVERMLAGRDSFAVSGVEGWPSRDLRHGDWVKVDAPRVRVREDSQYVLAP